MSFLRQLVLEGLPPAPRAPCRSVHGIARRRVHVTAKNSGAKSSRGDGRHVIDQVLPDVTSPREHPLRNLGSVEPSSEIRFQQYRSELSVPPVYERKVDGLGRAYGTGRRKTSVARVWIRQGKGEIVVNGKNFTDYFSRVSLRSEIIRPLVIVGKVGEMRVDCLVSGGGNKGQAEATRHGVARALLRWEPAWRPVLKKDGLLTRDSRVVEMKKYGKAKARKSFQWVKR